MSLFNKIKNNQKLSKQDKLNYEIWNYLLSTPLYAQHYGLTDNSINKYSNFLKLYAEKGLPQNPELIQPKSVERVGLDLIFKGVDFNKLENEPQVFLQGL